MKAHRHRAIADRCRTAPFNGAVGLRENPAAHGGVCYIDVCACGAERRSNCNGGHEERGEWVEAEREEG